MSAVPHAIAPAVAVAISAGSVSAKRSEVKEPEVKEPDLNTSDLKVLLYSPQHHVVQVGNASSVAPSPATTPDAMMPEIEAYTAAATEDPDRMRLTATWIAQVLR